LHQLFLTGGPEKAIQRYFASIEPQSVMTSSEFVVSHHVAIAEKNCVPEINKGCIGSSKISLRLEVIFQKQGRNQDLNLAKQKYEILTGHKNRY
jgi:hypothetical protein